jgi:DNA mismatch repair protein MutS
MTSIGSRMLRRWLDKPLRNRTSLESRQEAVESLFHQLIIRDDLRTALKEIYDLERLVSRVSFGNANARDLLAIERSLAHVPTIRQLCMDSKSETLQLLVAELDDCADVRQTIQAAIVDEPPVSIRDGGMIRDGYDEYLDQLKEASRNGKQWIAALEQQERERTGIKSLKISFNKVFGYYIEVTKANLNHLPEGVYERKQTLANAERFVTPELKEKETLILSAEEKMVDLEHQLFVQLRMHIAEQTLRLQRLAEILATIDVFQAFATVSASHQFVKPHLHNEYQLTIENGRHPVVESVLERGTFIANDTEFVQEQCRLMLITGPNMAGKSTYMRQVAVICILAQIGCFVPAQSASLPLLDRIFTRIGAADDLVSGQSTFMVEMMDIQVMTEKATASSLVIIDELGRGTSTSEGMAIAQAVIEHLHDQVGCKTLVSTHFHELAHVDDYLQNVRNFSMAVKESGSQVTFLRKLMPGAASTSYGIYCAQIAGLPASIIGRAYELQIRYEQKTEDHARTLEPVQLSLFDIPHFSATERDTVKQIIDLDIMNLNPMQALNLVYEWQHKLKNQ